MNGNGEGLIISRKRNLVNMSGATPLVADNPLQEVQTLVHHERKTRLYSIYVLVVMLVTYLLNQLDRYMLGIVTKPMAQELHYGEQACMQNSSVKMAKIGAFCGNATSQTECTAFEINETQHLCEWNYNGQGLEFEILAGPIFIVVYTLAGIPLGLLADFYNRRNLLAGCVALWSAMTLVTGFVNQYWQLAVVRFLVGIGEAGCTPFATSLISDYFLANQRAVAIGFYNWGIYIGYSMSYAVGNYITLSLGWRWAWYISGIPGLIVAVVMLTTVKEPKRQINESSSHSAVPDTAINEVGEGWKEKASIVLSAFLQPSLLLLCFAGSIRNAAGYVWAYNTQIYYQDIGVSGETIAKYMSVIPLVSGCIGVVLGGFIADRVVKRVGVYARVFVLIASQLVAAPFVAGALFFNPPFCFISLIPGYIIGEMWVGITLAVVVEVVPSHLRTSAVAVYMFIISNIGGNMPLLVPVLKSSFQNLGYDNTASLRGALYILYPGLYVVGALLFVVALIALRWDLRRRQNVHYEPLPTND